MQTISLAAAEASRPIVTVGTAAVAAGQSLALPISVTVPTGDEFFVFISGVPATVELTTGGRR
ncbi:MAG: hypothetical protein ACRC1K_26945 [Planctomycetia bacterium]